MNKANASPRVAKIGNAPNHINKNRGIGKGKTLNVLGSNKAPRRLARAALVAGVKSSRPGKGSAAAAGGQAGKRQEILQLKRKLRRALQRKKALTSGVAQQ